MDIAKLLARGPKPLLAVTCVKLGAVNQAERSTFRIKLATLLFDSAVPVMLIRSPTVETVPKNTPSGTIQTSSSNILTMTGLFPCKFWITRILSSICARFAFSSFISFT